MPWSFPSFFPHRLSPENITDLSKFSGRAGTGTLAFFLMPGLMHTWFEEMSKYLTLLLSWLVTDILKWADKIDISQSAKEFPETLNNKSMTFWKEKWVTARTRIYDFIKYKEEKELNSYLACRRSIKIIWSGNYLKRENYIFLRCLLFT